MVGAPGFEPGVICSQNRHVSRYTTPRDNGHLNMRMSENNHLNHIFHYPHLPCSLFRVDIHQSQINLKISLV